MKRREFLTLVGATAAWPLHAQQASAGLARIGFLRASAPPQSTLASLRRGLSERGFAEGKDYTLVTSWGDGSVAALPQLASALLAKGADLIVTDGTQTARAAHAATTTVPIVMAGGLDPVRAGLAASLSRPGGNVTGFTTQVIDVVGKTFQILTEIVHGASRVAILRPRGAGAAFVTSETQAAKALRLELKYIEIDSGPDAIDAAMSRAAAEQAQTVMLRGSPFFSTTQRKAIVDSAATHRLPTMYETRDFVELGGLVSYGTDFADMFRQAAGYIVRILNGAKPADLPIEQADKIELVINLKAAKTLGLTVPPTLIARADEVIE